MKNTEDRLAEMRKHVQSLQAPEQLEQRLQGALARQRKSRKRAWGWRVQVASVLLVMMLFGYHFNTLAYYGRTFLGFERVIGGALQNLNELGKGQVLDLSHTFADGRTLTLDGIMLDGNQLLAFCTLYSSAGDLEQTTIQLDPFMRGTFGRYLRQSGSGVISDDGTEMKYVFHFHPPRAWEKTMIIPFSSQDGPAFEFGEFRFVLDRQKAMGFTLRLAVRQSFEINTGKMMIHSLDASPTRTQVRGSVQSPVGLFWDTIRGERVRAERLDLRLLVNGQEWPLLGGSMTTDHRGMTFQMDYEALPEEIQSLSLMLGSFQTDHDVDQVIPLQAGQESLEMELHGHLIRFSDVTVDEAGTYVTVSTSESLFLSRVALQIDAQRIALEKTFAEKLEKREDGTIQRTRTLLFPGRGDDLTLLIERIFYDTEYQLLMPIGLD